MALSVAHRLARRGNATIFIFHPLSEVESHSRPDLHDIAYVGNVVALATVYAPWGGRYQTHTLYQPFGNKELP